MTKLNVQVIVYIIYLVFVLSDLTVVISIDVEILVKFDIEFKLNEVKDDSKDSTLFLRAFEIRDVLHPCNN